MKRSQWISCWLISATAAATSVTHGQISVPSALIPEIRQIEKELEHPEVKNGKEAVERGDLVKALVHYQAACSHAPENILAWTSAGAVLFLQAKGDEAIQTFEKGLAANPKNAQLWNSFGSLLQKLGKSERAIECFQKAASLDPTNFEPWNNIGMLRQQERQWGPAIEALTKAVELCPAHPEILINLFNVCADARQTDPCGLAAAQGFLATRPDMTTAGLKSEIARRLAARGLTIVVEAPTDASIRQYYETHPDQFRKRSIRLQSLSIPKEALPGDVVEELRASLVTGGDFAEAAKDYSDDAYGPEGGDRGWVEQGELRDDLDKAAFALKPGEISKVLEDDTHHRILRVADRRENTSLQAARVRIIDEIERRAREAKIDGWIAQARAALGRTRRAD